MLHLTSHGVLARAHRAIENSAPLRTAAITAVAAGVGLAAGRSRTARKVPAAAIAAGGALLSFMGLSGIGDGMAGAGATVLGYRYGATGRFTKPKRNALAPVAAPVATAPIRARRRG
jgi:hypothetical protein